MLVVAGAIAIPTTSFAAPKTFDEILKHNKPLPKPPAHERFGGGAKGAMKHAWNSVKKGASNLTGKRTKGAGKHSMTPEDRFKVNKVVKGPHLRPGRLDEPKGHKWEGGTVLHDAAANRHKKMFSRH
jgi:hypothetical protein